MAYSQPEIASVYFDDFFKTLPSMKGKRVAITGCTSGTGFITALSVARLGGQVIMLNRSSERATKAEQKIRDEVAGADVRTITCDLMSFTSVRSVATEYAKLFPEGGLDVLVTNAGVMALADKATEDGYDVQMQVNHISHFLLTKDLMPELEKAATAAGEARVVMATSNARHIPMNNDGPGLEDKYMAKRGGDLGGEDGRWSRYGQSKLANCVFTYALQDRLQAKGSKVKCLLTHPGLASTNLQVTTAQDSSAMNGQLSNIMKGAQSGEDGTMPMLSATCLPDAKSGDFFAPKDPGSIGPGTSGEAVKIDPEEYCTRQAFKDMLWTTSEAAVGEFAI